MDISTSKASQVSTDLKEKELERIFKKIEEDIIKTDGEDHEILGAFNEINPYLILGLTDRFSNLQLKKSFNVLLFRTLLNLFNEEEPFPIVDTPHNNYSILDSIPVFVECMFNVFKVDPEAYKNYLENLETVLLQQFAAPIDIDYMYFRSQQSFNQMVYESDCETETKKDLISITNKAIANNLALSVNTGGYHYDNWIISVFDKNNIEQGLLYIGSFTSKESILNAKPDIFFEGMTKEEIEAAKNLKLDPEIIEHFNKTLDEFKKVLDEGISSFTSCHVKEMNNNLENSLHENDICIVVDRVTAFLQDHVPYTKTFKSLYGDRDLSAYIELDLLNKKRDNSKIPAIPLVNDHQSKRQKIDEGFENRLVRERKEPEGLHIT